MPTSLDNGRRSPRALLRAVVARLLGAETLEPPESLELVRIAEALARWSRAA